LKKGTGTSPEVRAHGTKTAATHEPQRGDGRLPRIYRCRIASAAPAGALELWCDAYSTGFVSARRDFTRGYIPAPLRGGNIVPSRPLFDIM
jgi:hypothetical protein